MIYVLENTKINITKDLLVHGQLVSPHMMSTPTLRKSLNIEEYSPPPFNSLFEICQELDQSPWYRIIEIDLYDAKQNLKTKLISDFSNYKETVTFNYKNIKCNLSDSFKLHCLTKLFSEDSQTYSNILKIIVKYEETLDTFVKKSIDKIENASTIQELKEFPAFEFPKIDSTTAINNSYLLLEQKIKELEIEQTKLLVNVVMNNDTKAKVRIEQIQVEIDLLKIQLKEV